MLIVVEKHKFTCGNCDLFSDMANARPPALYKAVYTMHTQGYHNFLWYTYTALFVYAHSTDGIGKGNNLVCKLNWTKMYMACLKRTNSKYIDLHTHSWQQNVEQYIKI